VRNGAPRSVAKSRRVMTNEATPAILRLYSCIYFNINYILNKYDGLVANSQNCLKRK